MEANATVSTGHSQGNVSQARLESLKREHGVKVVTFIDCRSKETDPDTGERKISRRPWTTTVFHISQTEPLKGGGQ